MTTDSTGTVLAGTGPSTSVERPAHRIAAIDWMRGLVMILMVLDHASMAYDGHHVAEDSALTAKASTMALPGGEFFTRWITHLCAPTFVFLAGTALALSVERRVAKGTDGWQIDKGILIRGAIIALLDPTIISLGSGRWTFQVLFAIGLAMMCMAPLRHLPSWLLVGLAVGWLVLGELPTQLAWHPPGSASPLAAFTIATYGSDTMIVKYPLLPWLAMMMLGWVFGRHLRQFTAGKITVSPITVLWCAGIISLVVFAWVRANRGYGDMFLSRADNSWQQWLHVSKYPPSLSYSAMELGLLWLALALLMIIEPLIGVRPNGVFLVFGQTAMFFYLVHRLMLEVPATYFGLRGVGNLATTYWLSAALLVLLYPACRWFREFKAAHANSFLRYF
ncbi:MAG TPA: heparan-alpha-glucosaminide N-acetyltransferase domain-containing protein [Candidatus Limnocylindrales bacterium]|nr:heparan-alpha-glucosaminide N-acetyltransferase domain-containing protein [Candidatus Limnocylindrales bacterium]